MAIDLTGCGSKLEPATIIMSIAEDHPLIRLGNALPWEALADLVLPDLKATTVKGLWFTGRKLLVRVHLAAYILQKIYDLTDRQIEYALKDNAAYQLFAGKNLVPRWHPIDHTKVETFRSRLSPETQRKLANEISKVAVSLGFADPRETDIDSTVQEANIAYPADVGLMTKLASMGKKAFDDASASPKVLRSIATKNLPMMSINHFEGILRLTAQDSFAAFFCQRIRRYLLVEPFSKGSIKWSSSRCFLLSICARP